MDDRILRKDSYCFCCGIPLVSEKEFCTTCKSKIGEYSGKQQFLIYPYINSYTNIVLYWKNENIRSLSLLFARIISQFIKGNPELIGVPIVPVPPRPNKIKTKGWDQIEDICFYLEDSFPIKRILTRSDGHSQKGLSKKERKVNMIDKIHIKRGTLIPKKVIILDDVITTGSTIEVCKKCLMEAGCQQVLTLILFFN
ncbi:MAG: ComF family protein [Treponema sp.]